MKDYVHSPGQARRVSAATTAMTGGMIAFFFWQGLMNRVGDITAVVIALATIAMAIRSFQISLRWDHEGIVVRNHWKTHFILWNQIQEVGTGWMFIGGMRLARVVIFKGEDASVRSLATYPKRGRLEMLSRLTQAAQSKGVPVTIDPESFLANDNLSEQIAARKKRPRQRHPDRRRQRQYKGGDDSL